MLADQLVYLISLVTFTFGALTFSVLTVFYWRQRRLRLRPPGGSVLPAFAIVCGAAFVLNLLLQAVSEDSSAIASLSAVLDLATALLPPLLVHLIYCEEESGLPGRRVWTWVLTSFYVASAATAIAGERWTDWSDTTPAIRLAIAGCLGLAMQWSSRRNPTQAQRRHRWWNSGLLCLCLLASVMNLVQAAPVWGLLPDYVVLGFFCVALYYKERLVFFDLLIKRGAFFAMSLVGLTALFAAAPAVWQRLPAGLNRAWLTALLLTPLWLAAPWMYRRLGEGIDRLWLRRPYSPAEAERTFVATVQSAATEDELRTRAADSLTAIFQARSYVAFEADPMPPELTDGLCAFIEPRGNRAGWIALDPRPDSIPYLSDDHRLLQSLARTLAVVLDNVRFREREQHLRTLAGRAELRALRAQINPHFLFNALNAIAGLIPDQPQLADETVEQLAQVFRYTLRKSEKEWVRLDEEVEFAIAYLRVEQARFGARLRVDFEVDASAGAIQVPAMSIQPLIENAIKHGVSAVEGCGSVRLTAHVDAGALQIEVFDNGPGFPAGFSLAPAVSNGSGHALRNVADRLRGYYGDAARLDWECGAGGTRVRMRIPQ